MVSQEYNTSETFAVYGHRKITSSTLPQIISHSFQNILRSIEADEYGLFMKYLNLLQNHITDIHDASMEHTDEIERNHFIEYRMTMSRWVTVRNLTNYVVSKQIDKVRQKTDIGPQVIHVRKSLEESIRPLIEKFVEKALRSSSAMGSFDV